MISPRPFVPKHPLRCRALSALASATVALGLLSGCNTTASGPVGSSGATPTSAERVVEPKGTITIAKGMSKSEVIAILGEPISVEEVVRDNATAEIWTYKIKRVESSTIESDGEQERVYIEHATGKIVTVREPIYRNERVESLTTTKLLFAGDELVAFKEEHLDGLYDVGHR